MGELDARDAVHRGPQQVPTRSVRSIRLNDSTPSVDPDRGRLSVVGGDGSHELTLSDLSAFGTSLRAVLALRRAS
jgi:hypothetical protein